MKFKIKIMFEDDQGQIQEDIFQLEKNNDQGYCAGLSLQESKQILKALQEKIVLHQAKVYTHLHRACPCCYKQRRIKGYHSIQFKTLFGTVVIPSLRLYQCKCSEEPIKVFSILQSWLPEHTSPELQYIETKWASYMSFNKTSELLADVLPIRPTHNRETVRNHLHKIAKRQEAELINKPFCISGCINEWEKLPKPDKPITVGIDGGYVRSCTDRRTNFEVIVGKSFSKTQPAKRFGLVQTIDERPQRRLLHVLRGQGMQENQQITFLSDGADNMRDLQFIMHPESEHVLDWFHLTMRFTVLNQFAKGLIQSNPEAGGEVAKNLTSAKWYLWHGNVEKALDALEECCLIVDNDEIEYKNQKKMLKHLEELTIYVENNRHIIPNYGERWRYGETIASSFVESTVNEVVTKRMVKKQQMQWSSIGAHYLLQTRTAALNGDLPKHFEHWYPGLKIGNEHEMKSEELKKAA
jgi:hypothetical protein